MIFGIKRYFFGENTKCVKNSVNHNCLLVAHHHFFDTNSTHLLGRYRNLLGQGAEIVDEWDPVTFFSEIRTVLIVYKWLLHILCSNPTNLILSNS